MSFDLIDLLFLWKNF